MASKVFSGKSKSPINTIKVSNNKPGLSSSRLKASQLKLNDN